MKDPTFLEDVRDIRQNWHDAEYRRGFWAGFWPAFLTGFLLKCLFGISLAFAAYRLLS